MEAISCCKSERALSIRVFTFVSTSLTELNAVAAGAAVGSVFIRKVSEILVNHGADGFPHRHTHYISWRIQIENENWKLVIPAHGDGSGVHDRKGAGEHFDVGDLIITDGVGELEGIFIVDAIDASGFGDYVSLDFKRAQGGGSIGGKVRIAGAGGKDDDAAFFQVPDRAAADVGLGHLVHFDRAHDAGGNAHLFERV